MSRVVGIDLGTTNSCVAVMDGDAAVVIANQEGARTTPSVVGFAQGGERLVGHPARRQAMTNAENTVYAVKRLMGRKFDDPDVQHHIFTTPYEITPADNGDAYVRIRGRDYSPPEISAAVLSKMKQTAEEWLGTTVNDAVVTVPAYFDEAQRQATKDAGRIAGLNVLRIVNEPTAAALAYGVEIQGAARVAVYDLGGGTFDISILEMSDGVFRVRSTSGDTFLGGEDFDTAIVERLLAAFAAENPGRDLRGDRLALQRLKESSERAKIELSSSFSTEINLPFIAAGAQGPLHLTLELTRRELEIMVEPMVQKTIEPCRRAMSDAGVTPADIDVVILVGGQTRMPRIQQLVAELFGKEPSRRVNPDEVVAVGAAIQAGVLTGEVQEVLLLDVTPLSLGVETAGGVFTRLIHRNSAVPTRATEVFSTTIDNQPFVNIHVLQGEREMSIDNKSLAHFELTGIPPAPRGVPKIEVAFDIDADGLLRVSARDLGTGRAQSVLVMPTSGLSHAKLDRLLSESAEMAELDIVRRRIADARVKGEGLIHTSELALSMYGELLGDANRDLLFSDLADCRAGLESDDVMIVEEALARVEAAAQQIGEALYAGNPDDSEPSMMAKRKRDYYQVLGIGRDATEVDIKRAFRELARRHHPDVNPDNPDAGAVFREINEAYATLSVPSTRARYDRFGHDGEVGAAGAGTGFGAVVDAAQEMIGDVLRRRRGKQRGRDLRYTLEITFEEAAFGTSKTIAVPDDPSDPSSTRRRQFTVVIPAATKDGSIKRIGGEGEPGRGGAGAGDLHVVVRVADHPVYRRDGFDVRSDHLVSFSQAALGAVVEVSTLDGKVKMRIPEGTQPGRVFRIRSKGVPHGPGQNAPRGDHLVKISVAVPTELTPRQRELIEELARTTGEARPSASKKGLLDRVRSLLDE